MTTGGVVTHTKLMLANVRGLRLKISRIYRMRTNVFCAEVEAVVPKTKDFQRFGKIHPGLL